MSEDGAWNPNWWLEAKAASLERKRRAVAASALAKPGDAFLIVTEGTVTEPIYFNLLVRDLQLSVVRIGGWRRCQERGQTRVRSRLLHQRGNGERGHRDLLFEMAGGRRPRREGAPPSSRRCDSSASQPVHGSGSARSRAE